MRGWPRVDVGQIRAGAVPLSALDWTWGQRVPGKGSGSDWVVDPRVGPLWDLLLGNNSTCQDFPAEITGSLSPRPRGGGGWNSSLWLAGAAVGRGTWGLPRVHWLGGLWCCWGEGGLWGTQPALERERKAGVLLLSVFLAGNLGQSLSGYGCLSLSSWEMCFSGGVKNLSANAGDVRDVGSIPGSGKSPGGRHRQSTPICLPGESQDRGTWQATVYRVSKSQTGLKQLRTHTRPRK